MLDSIYTIPRCVTLAVRTLTVLLFALSTALLPAAVKAQSNQPPTVSVWVPANGATVPAGSNASLFANATDSDGTISKVDFYLGTTLLGTATAPWFPGLPYSYSWNNPALGTYTITAKATDNGGAVTTSASITITVVPNTPPIISFISPTPAEGATLSAGSSVMLWADATDSGGAVVKVEFFRATTLLGTLTLPSFGQGTSGYIYSVNNLAVGTYTFTAKATDNSGAVTTSAARTITVVANQAPTVSLTAPADGATFSAGSSLTLTADASDNGGAITKVEFYRGTTKLGTATTPPYSYTWNNLAVGTYTLTAKATDSSNAVAVSAARTITVVTNTPPTVSLTAPADGAVFSAGTNATLTADAADSGGAITKVEFYRGTTLLATDTSSPYNYTWNNLAVGTYTLTAKATDSSGVVITSAARTVTVLANQAPAISLTSPTANQSFAAPASIQLTAEASDPDNSLAKVEFFQGTTLIATVLSPPYATTWENVTTGSYQITAKATDALGVETSTAPITIGVANAQAGVFYLHTDHLNTPRLVTDEANRIVWRNQPTTEPFGNSPVEEDPDGDGTPFTLNLRFPGQYADRETNLNYNYFRDYDPATGRYVQSDPIGLQGGINPYAYVNNAPTMYIDPLGLYGWGLIGGGAAQAGLGGGAGYQASSGIGYFQTGLNPLTGNTGAFTQSGGFSSQYPYTSQWAIGASGGLGGGLFFTNANCAKQLLGPFDTVTVDLMLFGVQYATDGQTWMWSITAGKSFGLSVSRYRVTTTTASGCGCQ